MKVNERLVYMRYILSLSVMTDKTNVVKKYSVAIVNFEGGKIQLQHQKL